MPRSEVQRTDLIHFASALDDLSGLVHQHLAVLAVAAQWDDTRLRSRRHSGDRAKLLQYKPLELRASFSRQTERCQIQIHLKHSLLRQSRIHFRQFLEAPRKQTR